MLFKLDVFRKRERVSISQLRGSWRPFMVSMTMMLLLQTSGLLVLVYYAVSIFQVDKAASYVMDFNCLAIVDNQCSRDVDSSAIKEYDHYFWVTFDNS